MKSLKPLSIEIEYLFDWHKKVVNGKDDLKTKAFLEVINADVENRYSVYISNFSADKLLDITDSIFAKNHPELLSCYKSEGSKLKALKKAIRGKQSDDLKGTCQYCGIGKPKTFDHFLPISDYPEFAVCALNLLPCCKDCNDKKKAYWKEFGERGIINFYVDTFFSSQFLFANVVFTFGVPSMEYYIDNVNNTIPDKSYAIASKHYSRLELIELYKDVATDDLSELIRTFKLYTDNPTKDFLKDRLFQDGDQLQTQFGLNYWRRVLRNSLGQSDEFLEYIIKECKNI